MTSSWGCREPTETKPNPRYSFGHEYDRLQVDVSLSAEEGKNEEVSRRKRVSIDK